MTLPSLVDVFEEDPLVETSALGALAACFGHNFDTDHAILQATVDNDLPELERAVQALAAALPP